MVIHRRHEPHPNTHSQRKLLDGLRYLVREQLKLNQPHASDGWLTEEGLWLVSKTVCDKLRAHLLSEGIDGVPASNIAVFDVLQEHGIVRPAADGKAIWKATVTSNSGWTHGFTFLRISPAFIWDTNERPALFAGSVRVDEIAADGGSRPASGSLASVRATPTSAVSATNASLASSTPTTQFTFTYQGKRYRPTVPRTPIEANLRRARQQLRDIKERIRHGIFNFRDEFPDYKYSEGLPSEEPAQQSEPTPQPEPVPLIISDSLFHLKNPTFGTRFGTEAVSLIRKS